MSANMTLESEGLVRRADSSGFGPLLGKELRTWWGGRRWLFQAILWQVVINGLLLMVLFVLPNVAPAGAGMAEDPVANGLQGFFSIGSLALAIGVIILAGDALAAEIQSGTAEWLLTKPIARSAFVLAKLAAHSLGMLVILIALPGIVAFGLLSAAGEVNASGLATGLAVLALHTFFYLALVLTLGTLTRNRTAVIAIALAAALGGQMVFSLAAMLPIAPLALLTPWPLSQVATALAQGAALPPEMWLPILATVAWSAAFIGAALWRFERVEL